MQAKINKLNCVHSVFHTTSPSLSSQTEAANSTRIILQSICRTCSASESSMGSLHRRADGQKGMEAKHDVGISNYLTSQSIMQVPDPVTFYRKEKVKLSLMISMNVCSSKYINQHVNLIILIILACASMWHPFYTCSPSLWRSEIRSWRWSAQTCTDCIHWYPALENFLQKNIKKPMSSVKFVG